jgi:hypothetical protein
MPDNDDLSTLFTSSMPNSDQGKYLEIVKEMFDKSKTKLISELDDREIRAFTRIEFLASLLKRKYGVQVLDVASLVENFLQFRVSRKRKSRGEFVESITGDRASRAENSVLRSNQIAQMGGRVLR